MSPESKPMETTFSRRKFLDTGYDSWNLVSDMRVGLGTMDMVGKKGRWFQLQTASSVQFFGMETLEKMVFVLCFLVFLFCVF